MKREDAIIKNLSLDDAQYVYSLEQGSFKIPWSRNSVENFLKSENKEGYGIIHEGSMVGYALISKLLDEITIERIAIDEKFRGYGLSTLLMNKIIEENKEFNFTLEVSEKNKSALCLYKSCGFKAEGQRKDYYAQGENAIIMWRKII
ncbi:MAG: ribosomal protein S18-alanine N-acetyltransferase [Peptoniphilus sp.]|nr:ribosomal protein S18-alanine N-acetyltransferase [Peptoniphilus sp.]